jgi:hypothetical protein
MSGAEANSAIDAPSSAVASSVLDRHFIEEVTDDLGTTPGLAEKDWHVVRALAVIPY